MHSTMTNGFPNQLLNKERSPFCHDHLICHLSPSGSDFYASPESPLPAGRRKRSNPSSGGGVICTSCNVEKFKAEPSSTCLLRSALMQQTICLSPSLRTVPSESRTNSSPWGSPTTKSVRSKHFKHSQMWKSEKRPSGSRLKRRVPLNTAGSWRRKLPWSTFRRLQFESFHTWGMMVILFLCLARSALAMSAPSMEMLPSMQSARRNRSRTREDLPAPVRPTMPTYNRRI